uniref:DnaA regulatory inactivator Hda n=1 Tax=Ningiella ruwaisensis TaxID=2364274 RepID=UPI0010A08868|nr:DnaA regulatory inactivator Hda [Ningiella ruwaisensis]
MQKPIKQDLSQKNVSKAVEQLVLPVRQQNDLLLENFIAGKNIALLTHVRTLLSVGASEKEPVNVSAQKSDKYASSSPNNKDVSLSSVNQQIVYLHGSEGTGKTHLLLGACKAAEAKSLRNQYIDLTQLVSMPSQIIEGIGKLDLIAVDNIQCIADNRDWQIAIFDAINQFIEAGRLSQRAFIISANASVSQCQFSLPDLASRLTWGTTYKLSELSEQDKFKALKTHLHQRGMNMGDDAVQFLMKRSPRDMHRLMKMVDKLDSLSLQNQRKLTIPFLKDALAL